MAVIRFDPTWIASVIQDEIGNVTYSYDYPLILTAGVKSDAYTCFDMDEIGRILGLFQVTGKTLNVQRVATDPRLSLILHKSSEMPSETNVIWGESVSSVAYGDFVNGYFRVGLDYSIVKASPTGPVPLTLQGAISEGFQGFMIREYTHEQASTSQVYIELEGNFDNPRPALHTPTGGVMRAVDEYIQFRWQHNSPLKQVAFELQYRIKGTTAWETIQVETGSWEHFLEPNTLTPNNYEWRVRTTSQYGFVSPWSLLGTFTVAEISPSPVYVTPLDGSVVGEADLLVKWTSVNQAKFEFMLLDTSQVYTHLVVYSTSQVSNIQELMIPNILENGKPYKLMLRVNQAGGIFSAWNSIDITVEYTPPAMPVVTLTPDKETASLEIDIYNPLPTGTEPNVIKQELFRREQGGEWIKLANPLSNSAYVDHALASGKMYEYKLILYGDNNTLTTTDIFTGSVGVKHSQLNLTSDPAQMVRLMYNPEVSFSNNYSATSKHFAGRTKPVTEFGEVIKQSGAVSFVVDDSTLAKLYGFLALQETLLFRDSRGKRIFVTASDMAVDYHRATGLYEISLNLSEVYYKEGIE